MIFVNYITVIATFASLSLYAVDAASLKIIGGEDADIKDYPYMASIRLCQNEHLGYIVCGASIIDKNTLLTAAHCITGAETDMLAIVYGRTNQTDLDFETKVSKIIIHENFTIGGEWANDIALLKVDPPMELSETVKAVKLPKANAPNPEKQTATLTGWGSLDQGGSFPELLQKIDVIVVPDKECKHTWDWMSTIDLTMDTKLCAAPDVTDRNMRGQCVADEGGPLVIDGVQYGVASFFYRFCGNSEAPPVFTKVSHYVDWISSHL